MRGLRTLLDRLFCRHQQQADELAYDELDDVFCDIETAFREEVASHAAFICEGVRLDRDVIDVQLDEERGSMKVRTGMLEFTLAVKDVAAGAQIRDMVRLESTLLTATETGTGAVTLSFRSRSWSYTLEGVPDAAGATLQ